ncbi:MAG: hypothetical protein ACI86M_002850 [Saprospiraceae bacterium]|jgi:hypothetical protein
MNKTIPIIIIAITFIWAGMLCGISFLEAPLKFQAPGITLPLGLGIGKLVFGALTKIEMPFSLFIIACLLLSKAQLKTWKLFLLPILIVALDNAWLMPILDNRIDMIMNGVTPPESNAHWWYVALELIKLISLMIAGVLVTKRLMNYTQSDI